jgi:hypothetical protein
MKYFVTTLFALSMLFGAFNGFTGTENSTGKTGASGAPGEVTCASCHSGGGAGSGSVTIAGDFTGTEYISGQTYNMTVTVVDAGVNTFGFNLVALKDDETSAGSLTAGSSSQVLPGPLSRQNITHTSAGTSGSGGQKVFNFTWTAPTDYAGQITFYVAANAANGNGNANGDRVYTSTLQLSGAAVTSLTGNLQESSFLISPNPVAHGNVLNLSLLSGVEQVSIIDISGRTMLRMPVTQGSDYLQIPTAGLPKGVYIVRTESAAGAHMRRVQIQ